MSKWSLPKILDSLHRDIQGKLEIARDSVGHPGTKGDASENVWLELLQKYLPERYQVEKAHVVDSRDAFSQQIDVVIFDRQYSPFIFKFKGATVVPAESVYAVFEAKQSMDLENIRYAQKKATSVRQLHRTSLPIPHAGGTYPPKPPIPILAGILTLASEWNPAFGKPLRDALAEDNGAGKLDMGCVAACGYFQYDKGSDDYVFDENSRAATAFLFGLISRLQFSGTVPMIDIGAYGEWLGK